MNRETLVDGLSELLRHRTGAEDVTLGNVYRMVGGSSRETWSVDARLDDETRNLVVRVGARSSVLGETDVDEFALLQAAHAAGVRVPEPYFRGNKTFGEPCYVMERVEGETLGHRLVHKPRYKEAREVIVGQMARSLARIHAIDVDGPELGFLQRPARGKTPAEDRLERLRRQYEDKRLDPHPSFELAFRWLRDHLPEAERVTLVHGDYRVGNVIFGEDGLRAVLDWEGAHVGDPRMDLGWMCVRAWRFGAEAPVAGIAGRDELLEAYERESGVTVDREAVRFWEVFGNLRWGVITMLQARRSLDAEESDVELAAIGRRTAATEWEILRFLEGEA